MTVSVNNQLCVGCGQCELSCPERAIRAFGIARINEDKCTECLICFGFCPISGALEVSDE
ncbi:MAG: 4Fe-4S binding protein [Desulfobacterales bacterium]|nr:MAG: 4Fe-4S binding protein [Desulfobacterales bacterium]